MSMRGAADERQCPAMQNLHLGEQLALFCPSFLCSARSVSVSLCLDSFAAVAPSLGGQDMRGQRDRRCNGAVGQGV